MARTIAQIYAEAISEKQSQASLAQLAPQQDTEQQLLTSLASSSKVAIWRLILYVVCVVIHIHEVLFDLHVEEVEQLIRDAPPGTVTWYQRIAMLWQFGDQMEYSDYRYAYPALDESKQLVRRVGIQERYGGTLLFKVAKLDAQGSPLPLAPVELTSFTAYLRKVRFAGTEVAVVSQTADELAATGTVYYDGEVPLSEVKANVDAAVEGYLNNLPWNAELSAIRFIDAVQSAKGVTDVVLASLTAKPFALSAQPVGRERVASAGYFSTPTPLSDLFTFTVEN